ncbi:HTH_Tnp_Tc3_2 domain-containing protein [Trichonephila clavipes]|nr:HTH_Tnp_Tc3_2 domain-containing protein [Trichonephila clavipes]
MQRDCALRIAGRGCLASFSVEYKSGGVGTSGCERCHLHEDQAKDTLDRPVVEKTATSRKAYQHVSDFDKGPFVAYRDWAVYRIAARVYQDPMSVSRIWNRWFQDSNTERLAGSQRLPITSSRRDRHVTRMALMDRAATS